jgi:hypothetical protein
VVDGEQTFIGALDVGQFLNAQKGCGAHRNTYLEANGLSCWKKKTGQKTGWNNKTGQKADARLWARPRGGPRARGGQEGRGG